MRHGCATSEKVALGQEREVRASACHPKDQLHPPREAQEHQKKKKKNRKNGMDGPPELNLVEHDLKRFPKYEPKPFESLANKKFSIPCMKNAKGEVIPTVLSGVSLGIRPQAVLLPRPLHDPMQDHAIVLYDPTIDDRETEEERQEREKEERKEREEGKRQRGEIKRRKKREGRREE